VDVDTVTLIDLTPRPIRAVEYVTVGIGAEGLALSPDGNGWPSRSRTGRTGRRTPDAGRAGRLLLFSLQGTKAAKVAGAPTGRNTQGVTFTPEVPTLRAELREQELQVFRVTGRGSRTRYPDQGQGPPGSIRVAP